MDPEIKNQLSRFYTELRAQYNIKNSSVKMKSLLLTLLDMNSNPRFQLLGDAAIAGARISAKIKNELLLKDYIQDTPDIGMYTLTAHGIWAYEFGEEIIDINMLLEYYNKKYFKSVQLTAQRSIKEKHKIVLLAFIALRFFSVESPAKLKVADKLKDVWKKVLLECNTALSQAGVIRNLENLELFGKPGNEHEVVNLIRHTDDLPKQTKNLYVSLGDQQYYLNISEEGVINPEALRYLFSRIFENTKLDHSTILKLLDTMNRIAYEDSIYLHDPGKNIFCIPRYDMPIKDAIMTQVHIKK